MIGQVFPSMNQSPATESSAESSVLFCLSDTDFSLFRWNEDATSTAQLLGFRSTPTPTNTTSVQLRREHLGQIHLTFGAAEDGKDVTITIPRVHKFSVGDLGISSISPRDVLFVCQDVKPSVPGSYTLVHEESGSGNTELVWQDPLHYCMLKFANSKLRMNFLDSLRTSLLGAESLQKNSENVGGGGTSTVSISRITDSASDATIVSGNVPTAADPAVPSSSISSIPVESDITTVPNQTDVPSQILLSRKRNRWKSVSQGDAPDKRNVKRCCVLKLLKGADYQDLVDDVVRYAQIHGSQEACGTFSINKNDIHKRICHLYSKKGRYSIVNRDVCPSSVTSNLLEHLNSQTRFSLDDVVDKAKELLVKYKSRKRFLQPSLNWAARFVIHHDVRTVELDGDDILGLADFPLLPASALFKPVQSDKDVRDNTWELRKTVVDYAEKTTLRIASKLFTVPRSTISEWRNKLESRAGKELPCGSGRKISYSKDMDKILVSWITQESQQGRKVTVGDLQTKAKEVIGKEIPEFLASRGWVNSFCRRNSVKFPMQNGAGEVRLSKCLEESRYCPRNKATSNTSVPSVQSQDLDPLSSILNELLYDHCWTAPT